MPLVVYVMYSACLHDDLNISRLVEDGKELVSFCRLLVIDQLAVRVRKEITISVR